MAKKDKVETKTEEKKEEKEKKPTKTKIECSECHSIMAVRPEVFDKRIPKYGDEETLRANYRCRECRKKNKDEIFDVDRKKWVPKPAPAKKEEKEEKKD